VSRYKYTKWLGIYHGIEILLRAAAGSGFITLQCYFLNSTAQNAKTVTSLFTLLSVLGVRSNLSRVRQKFVTLKFILGRSMRVEYLVRRIKMFLIKNRNYIEAVR
jgi:hypothetical protein